MERPKPPVRRCAIYTRKSSEEVLEQDFNSLHAQREACEAFIKSQAGEGWRLIKDRLTIQLIGLAENRLPAIFSVAEQWRKRLQSEVEAGGALNALVDRIDLSDSSIRLALKLPIPSSDRQPAECAAHMMITRLVPMQIKRRGVEMRLVIKGNGTPAPRADQRC